MLKTEQKQCFCPLHHSQLPLSAFEIQVPPGQLTKLSMRVLCSGPVGLPPHSQETVSFISTAAFGYHLIYPKEPPVSKILLYCSPLSAKAHFPPRLSPCLGRFPCISRPCPPTKRTLCWIPSCPEPSQCPSTANLEATWMPTCQPPC